MSQRRCYSQQLVAEHNEIPVVKATHLFELNRSSFYYDTKPTAIKRSARPLDPNLCNKLLGLRGYELTLGHRKTAHYLSKSTGVPVNHKKVYRHMKALKLLQPKHVRRPKMKKKSSVLWYCPLKSNMRWEADLTVISYANGHVFLFSVIDVFDKELIGSHIGLRCRSEEAISTLKNAVQQRFLSDACPHEIELVLRLDRGCQFTAHNFVETARLMNISVEFCDIQAPNQKPFIESFFASFKIEEVYRSGGYESPLQAIHAWPDYLYWYNNLRPHGALNYLSPVQFRNLCANRCSKSTMLLDYSLV